MVQNKVTEGGRNNALFHYGVYAKSKWPENWKTKIILFNESAMAQPLSDIEVNIITKQLSIIKISLERTIYHLKDKRLVLIVLLKKKSRL